MIGGGMVSRLHSEQFEKEKKIEKELCHLSLNAGALPQEAVHGSRLTGCEGARLQSTRDHVS